MRWGGLGLTEETAAADLTSELTQLRLSDNTRNLNVTLSPPSYFANSQGQKPSDVAEVCILHSYLTLINTQHGEVKTESQITLDNINFLFVIRGRSMGSEPKQTLWSKKKVIIGKIDNKNSKLTPIKNKICHSSRSSSHQFIKLCKYYILYVAFKFCKYLSYN